MTDEHVTWFGGFHAADGKWLGVRCLECDHEFLATTYCDAETQHGNLGVMPRGRCSQCGLREATNSGEYMTDWRRRGSIASRRELENRRSGMELILTDAASTTSPAATATEST